MCMLYVSFGSKLRPMGSAVLFILRSRLLLYSVGSLECEHSANCFVWI